MYKIRIKEHDFFLVSDKIKAADIKIDDGYVFFKTSKRTLNYLDDNEINYEIVDTMFYKIKESLFINKGLLFGILLFVSIVYINQYRVSEISFNDDFIINEEIESALNDEMTRFLFWDFHTGNLENTARNFRKRFVHYQWITISKKASIIHVDISNYDEFNVENKDLVLGNIVAKREGIIRYYNIFSGGNNIELNKFVNKGDILIASDLLINKEQEHQDLTEARGLVLANTFDKFTHTIYKEDSKNVITSNVSQFNQINFFGFNFNFRRRQSFDNYKEIIRTRFNFFGIFKFKEIEHHEKYDIMITYNKDEAIDLVKSMIVKDFYSNIVSDLETIEVMHLLSIEENDVSFTVSILVQKLESIGIFQVLE